MSTPMSPDHAHEVLAQIAELLRGYHTFESDDTTEGVAGAAGERPSCSIKQLPKRLLGKAAELAVRTYPVNAPAVGFSPAGDGTDGRLEVAVMVTKYWGPQPRTLSVSFLQPTAANLRTRILSHMNAWNQYCGINFAQTNGTGDVRIAFGPTGYWSYLGTDIKLIPANKPTMNLQGFSMATPESEYKRVVRHETGHTLGMPHEHMRQALVARIDPAKAYAYFLRTQGWDKAMVDAQVLTPLSEASLMSTPADQTSIMCYQLPGAITKDGKPITGGIDINATDGQFAGKVYPKPGHAPAGGAEAVEDWDESDDVSGDA